MDKPKCNERSDPRKEDNIYNLNYLRLEKSKYLNVLFEKAQ